MTTRRQISPEGRETLRANAAKARAARHFIKDPSDRPYPRGGSIAADFETVLAYAEPRGILFREWDELPRVNTVRDRAGLLPFKRLFPVKGRFG